MADDPSARFTLAVLYAALLTAECLADLPPARTVVLDGGFVQEPMFGRLVAALVPDARVLVNHDPHGTATGAALLAGHETRSGPAPLAADRPTACRLPHLASYRSRWRDLSSKMEQAS